MKAKDKKKNNPFIKDYFVTIDYGNNSRHCYLFLKHTKVKIMDFLSKTGIGEATKAITFSEIGKTKYPDVFWFVVHQEETEEE